MYKFWLQIATLHLLKKIYTKEKYNFYYNKKICSKYF